MYIKQTLDFLFLQAMQALLTHLLLFATGAAPVPMPAAVPDFGGPRLPFALKCGLLFVRSGSRGEITGGGFEAEVVAESRKM